MEANCYEICGIIITHITSRYGESTGKRWRVSRVSVPAFLGSRKKKNGVKALTLLSISYSIVSNFKRIGIRGFAKGLILQSR